MSSESLPPLEVSATFEGGLEGTLAGSVSLGPPPPPRSPWWSEYTNDLLDLGLQIVEWAVQLGEMLQNSGVFRGFSTRRRKSFLVRVEE